MDEKATTISKSKSKKSKRDRKDSGEESEYGKKKKDKKSKKDKKEKKDKKHKEKDTQAEKEKETEKESSEHDYDIAIEIPEEFTSPVVPETEPLEEPEDIRRSIQEQAAPPLTIDEEKEENVAAPDDNDKKEPLYEPEPKPVSDLPAAPAHPQTDQSVSTKKDSTKATPAPTTQKKEEKSAAEGTKQSTSQAARRSSYGTIGKDGNHIPTQPSLNSRTASHQKLVTYPQQKVFTKDIDLVLFGASGFTGRLACLYLADHPDKALVSNLHIAIAGRSKEKLKHLRNEMIAINSFMGRVSILYANAFDTEELDRITSKTRCLLNFAGPYTWYGSQVVESCVRNMCHYVDLSLELPWVMKMIGKHQAKAVKNKTRVVNACGFNSVVSDLGVLSVVAHMKNVLKEEPSECLGLVAHMKTGVSGVSPADWMVENLHKEFQSYYDEMRADPQYYNPEHLKTYRDPPDPVNAVYMKDIKLWTSPNTAGPVNSRVVRRSSSLLSYGDKFTYTEVVMNANWMSAKLSSKMSFKSSQGIKHGDPVDPRTGFKNCSFEMRIIGKSPHTPMKHVVCEVKGSMDPEYQLTSRMTIEAGILLSKFHESLPLHGKDAYGFHTPATALGFPFRERLKQYAGVTFNIEETSLPS